MWKMNKKGVVAVWVGITLPVLLTAVALPIEVGNWEVARIQLQRSADLAAEAGLIEYHQNLAKGRAWVSARSLAMTNAQVPSNDVTFAFVPGFANGLNTALTLTITKRIHSLFPRAIVPESFVTITVTSTAEFVDLRVATYRCVVVAHGADTCTIGIVH